MYYCAPQKNRLTQAFRYYYFKTSVINICIYSIATVHEVSVEAEKDSNVMNCSCSAFCLRVEISRLTKRRGY